MCFPKIFTRLRPPSTSIILHHRQSKKKSITTAVELLLVLKLLLLLLLLLLLFYFFFFFFIYFIIIIIIPFIHIHPPQYTHTTYQEQNKKNISSHYDILFLHHQQIGFLYCVQYAFGILSTSLREKQQQRKKNYGRQNASRFSVVLLFLSFFMLFGCNNND